MPEYETRIRDGHGQVSLTATSYQASDFAAVRSGRKLCGEGETLEVWRGESCIFSEPFADKLALTWPVVGRVLG